MSRVRFVGSGAVTALQRDDGLGPAQQCEADDVGTDLQMNEAACTCCDDSAGLRHAQ